VRRERLRPFTVIVPILRVAGIAALFDARKR
jgi:hypothetical protein